MDKFRSRDGLWTVEVVSLRAVPKPSRLGDAPHDGQWYLIRYAGKTVDHVKTTVEVASYVPLDELEEVE